MNQVHQQLERLSPLQRKLLWNWLQKSRTTNGTETRKRLAAYLTLTEPEAGLQPASDLDQSKAEIIDRVRVTLREQLPKYMVPDTLSIVESIPRLPNGKVDVRKLPIQLEQASQEQSRMQAPSAPCGDIEHILLEIWKDLLSVELLGVHDNFFEFGGDSIISIQVISRAREAGLEIEPRQLAERPTVAELAQVVSLQESINPEVGEAYGRERTLPIQSWFLERKLANRAHWNQCRLLEVTVPISAETVRRAVQLCVRQHDALRSHFVCEDGRWMQVICEPEQFRSVFDVVPVSDQSEYDSHIESYQASFELDTGVPLVNFALLERSSSSDTLVITAHHLVMDHVSWQLLIEDLGTFCKQIHQEEEPTLRTKTTSILEWSRQLQAFAKSESARSALPYWTSLGDDLAEIPCDRPRTEEITEATAVTLTLNLGASETTYLLESNDTYQTNTQDLLLAALAQTLTSWCNSELIKIEMEGHGRDIQNNTPNTHKADVSRTLGWFTSYFPITLDLTDAKSPSTAIKSVKEQRATLPHGGLSYGVLRYLGDETESKQLRTQLSTDVLFNFTGRQNSDSSSAFRTIGSADAWARSKDNQRSHALEINAGIIDGDLTIGFTYSSLLHDSQTIEKLGASFFEHLRSLVEHCRSPEAGGYTPSDFPDVELSQEELDELLNELD